ncbi:DoxX family membrane protein [Paraburkholderia sp. 1N]|uniref:DoxX family membrane protein n=1 Tax=Paraburkholderia solitsugae TaxID=2675748 RepID=A0ABX2BTF2_9BURK|nr:DoxX family protein [Paraburkholderia solitsugae]NPT43080.1 DoxX family membrane protein [Paraburkholderia solitsugae]
MSPDFQSACFDLARHHHLNKFRTMEYVNIIVVCAFLAAAVVNLIGPQTIRAEFAKWGYPDWLRMTVATAEFVGSILLFIPRTQWLGASILLVVTLGILVSFTRSKEWMRMQYPFVLLFLLVAILEQTLAPGRILPG